MASIVPNRLRRSSPNEERPHRRYDETKPSDYRHHVGSRSDHELCKLSEERTSDEESLSETDINENAHGDVRPAYRGFDSSPRKYDKPPNEYPVHGYGKATGSHQTTRGGKCNDDERSDVDREIFRATVTPLCQRDLRDYVDSVNLPQALMAMRKLERLKELQRQRDQSERYYSQEIKRLIGEHFFNRNPNVDGGSGKNRDQKSSDHGNRIIGDATNPGEQRIRAGGFSKELEPCGTMTMITRLDCGCVRETTTPIFNSSIGHVKKCEVHRYQTCNVSKLTPTNPQETSHRPSQPPARVGNVASNPARVRTRLPPDCAAYQKLQSIPSRDLEYLQHRRCYGTQPRTAGSPRQISPVRNNSPVTKYSDGSSNSARE